MNIKKRYIFAIVLLFLIISAASIIFILLKRNESNGIPPISSPISAVGGGGNLQISIEQIQSIVKRLSKNPSDLTDLPVSYGFPVLPENYVNQILALLVSQHDFVSKTTFQGETGNWKIYDFSNGKFQEIYSPFYNESEGSNVATLALNESTKKFIVISKDVKFAHDNAYIQELIRVFEHSTYYKDSSYQYLDIQTTSTGDLGYEIQFGFSTLYSPYLVRIHWGIGIIIDQVWHMDYASSDTYVDFIKSIKTDSNGEIRKQELLNNY